MSPEWLVEDLRNVLAVYGDNFDTALDSLVQALGDCVAGRVSTSPLKYELGHVRSYHF